MSKPFQFDAIVSVLDFGRMSYSVLYAPPEIVRELSLADNPRLRIDGFVADQRFKGAFQPAGENQYYLILSKRFLKSAGLSPGDTATALFTIADPDAVDVPLELQHALQANPDAAAKWDALTPGKRRGLAYRVASAKREKTKSRRVEEVLEELLEQE